MTTPDDALLWAREKMAKNFSPTTAKAIREGKWDADTDLQMWAEAFRAGHATADAGLLEALEGITRAAEGLSHGVDWNNGTHAKTHGYRQKLLDALPAARAAIAAAKGGDR